MIGRQKLFDYDYPITSWPFQSIMISIIRHAKIILINVLILINNVTILLIFSSYNVRAKDF